MDMPVGMGARLRTQNVETPQRPGPREERFGVRGCLVGCYVLGGLPHHAVLSYRGRRRRATHPALSLHRSATARTRHSFLERKPPTRAVPGGCRARTPGCSLIVFRRHARWSRCTTPAAACTCTTHHIQQSAVPSVVQSARMQWPYNGGELRALRKSPRRACTSAPCAR
jgi:hypothetical protein